MLFVHVSSQKGGAAKADPKRKKSKSVRRSQGHQNCPLLHPCAHLVLSTTARQEATSPLIQSVEVKSKKNTGYRPKLIRNLFTVHVSAVSKKPPNVLPRRINFFYKVKE